MIYYYSAEDVRIILTTFFYIVALAYLLVGFVVAIVQVVSRHWIYSIHKLEETGSTLQMWKQGKYLISRWDDPRSSYVASHWINKNPINYLGSAETLEGAIQLVNQHKKNNRSNHK